MKTHTLLAVSALAVACSACTQIQTPTTFSADRVATQSVQIGHKDCTLIQGRVFGESKGLTLFGLIPIKDASEAEAIDNMYKASRNSGAVPEGHARTYVNTSIERSSTFVFPFFTRPAYRATGDLVQFNNDASSTAEAQVVRGSGKTGIIGTIRNILPL